MVRSCGLLRALLGDYDGLYDPTDFNDRLLLGLKGIMSEAELHFLRLRMHEGRLNKARRGELFNHAPIGYVREPGGGLALDPDEQAQQVVRMVFDQFDRQGSLHGLLRYLVHHSLRLPVRPHYGPNRGKLLRPWFVPPGPGRGAVDQSGVGRRYLQPPCSMETTGSPKFPEEPL